LIASLWVPSPPMLTIKSCPCWRAVRTRDVACIGDAVQSQGNEPILSWSSFCSCGQKRLALPRAALGLTTAYRRRWKEFIDFCGLRAKDILREGFVLSAYGYLSPCLKRGQYSCQEISSSYYKLDKLVGDSC
jgi:hypothetical protein